MAVESAILRAMNLYRRFEAWCRTQLSAEQLAEAEALDLYLKRRWPMLLLACLSIWSLATLLLKSTLRDGGWAAAAGLSLVMLLAGLLIAITAYYGHAKFGSRIKVLLLFAVFSSAGAIVGGLLGRYHRKGTIEGFFSIESLTEGVLGHVLAAGVVTGGCFALLSLAIVSYRRRQLERRNQELMQRALNESLARQALDARLRLLQAQVEPHFLFNTLGSIRELAEERAPEAARLTADLIRFLRGGLGSLRMQTTTLAAEFEMIEAYLSVMKTRMGDRLRWQLELPSNLRDMPLPPAMLISLVENAIKHGLEPAPEGGSLRVSAHSDGERLYVEVIDSGLGLHATDPPPPFEGSGLGLRNIRERLTALYGEEAACELLAAEPKGTLARIMLPLSRR